MTLDLHTLHRGLWILCLTLIAITARANNFSVFIDIDQNSNTGCDAVLVPAGDLNVKPENEDLWTV